MVFVPARMVRLAPENHQVFRLVVVLVSVYVMDDLAFPERAPDLLLRHDAVRMSSERFLIGLRTEA